MILFASCYKYGYIMKNSHSNKWFILLVIILMYLPVSIDATILHVAAPSLSLDLNASSNEVLWIIDIYSLVMACFLLPMGVLGDKYGVKWIALSGIIIFGLASFLAMLSETALMLTLSRGFLALGAAMILPATLAALRVTFIDNRERAIALGVWSAVGTGGAALGPLVGGFLLEYYSWHSVFFINIPICVIVAVLTLRTRINNEKCESKKINITDPLLLISSILLVILFMKSVFKDGITVNLILMLLGGMIVGYFFIKRQIIASEPMIDISLFKNRIVVAGIILAMLSMISLVGFEFFVSQELQLAMGMSALEAGLFLLPLILASCLSGPCVGWAIDFIGVRTIAFMGIFVSAISFAGLSVTDFRSQAWQAWGFMVLLGFCIEAALLASTTAIMGAAPPGKGGQAGAIEGMAYEFGAGIGVVMFGLMMSSMYSRNIQQHLHGVELPMASKLSLPDTIAYAEKIGGGNGEKIMMYAKQSFIDSHFNVMIAASIILFVLSFVILRLMKRK